jgi:hypothetical protein
MTQHRHTYALILERLDAVLKLFPEIVVLQNIDDAKEVNGSAGLVVRVRGTESTPIVREA